MSSMRVYFFGGSQADGNAGMKNLLGGKGANLAEMVNLGVPVPPGFTVTTEQCIAYQQSHELSPELKADVKAALARVEKVMERKFADASDPARP
jgi:pyruvate,orthophosphate dikinase